MLWEASVAGLTSVAVMATGPGMRILAGACVAPIGRLLRPQMHLPLTLHCSPTHTCVCTAGVLVVARPNITLPGYRQHLGQALLGAYDMARDVCPDSMRPTYCRQMQGCSAVHCKAALPQHLAGQYAWAGSKPYHPCRRRPILSQQPLCAYHPPPCRIEGSLEEVAARCTRDANCR